MVKVHFEWDSVKDKENQKKHGVSFATAQYAFADPDRVIAEDTGHSRTGKTLLLLWQSGRWHIDRSFYVSKGYDSNHRSRILAKGQEYL